MKLVKFGNDFATIGGKKVPYSLLGALAAILGAFLIWKFNQNGGLQLGQQAPDLAGLGQGSDLGSFGDLNNLVNTLPKAPSPYIVPSLSYPVPAYSYPLNATTDYSGSAVDNPAAVGPSGINFGQAGPGAPPPGDAGIGVFASLSRALSTAIAPSKTRPAPGTVLRQDYTPPAKQPPPAYVAGIDTSKLGRSIAALSTPGSGGGTFTL